VVFFVEMAAPAAISSFFLVPILGHLGGG
jgi:hypothetical protein